MFHAASAPRKLRNLGFFSRLTFSVVHTSALKGGYNTVIMRRFDLETFVANIEKFAINDLILAPPIVVAIIVSYISSEFVLSHHKQDSIICVMLS